MTKYVSDNQTAVLSTCYFRTLNALLTEKTVMWAEINIKMSEYRKLLFKTTAKFFCFDLSMNILRLFGGYGSLAYAGHKL